MSKAISMKLDTSSINDAIKELKEYKKWVARKEDKLLQKLATLGATKASLGYARAIYNGTNDVEVSVEKSSNGYTVVASGKSVAFIEFGAGITYGYGHPQAGEFGVGPGTYPDGKGHWDDPQGWFIPKEAGGGHSYGNPPAMALYNAAREIEQAIIKVAKEVFASG